MVRLDKIYTKGGDNGFTSLGGGQRVNKNNPRVKAYGDLDEVNAAIGISICYCNSEIKKTLLIVQNDIFDLGADLCFPEDSKKKTLKVSSDQVTFLESEIDRFNSSLTDLKSFVLPGGSKASSFLHLARCTIRRAERSLADLKETQKINEIISKYINRLSDLLFVLARFENKSFGDVLWEPAKFQKRS